MSNFASSSRVQAQLPSHLVSSPWLRFEHSSSLSPYFETSSSTSHPSYQSEDDEEDSEDEENDSPLSNYHAFPITPPPVVFNLTLPPTKRASSSASSTTPSLSHSHSSSSSSSTQNSSSSLPLTPTVSRHLNLNLNLGLVSTSPSSSSCSSSGASKQKLIHQDTPRPIEPRDGYFGRSTSSITLPPRRRKDEAAGEVGRSMKRRAKVEKWQIESVVVWPSSNSRRMGIVA